MTTTLALALHPGHGSTDPTSLLHYLTEPVHVVLLGMAAALVALLGAAAWRAIVDRWR